MGFADNYLSSRWEIKAELEGKPPEDLGLIIVIPCINEANLIKSLQSIKDCEQPDCSVEVICVINSSEITPTEVIVQNRQTYSQARDWGMKFSEPGLKFHFVYQSNLDDKIAGVGIARKIGMDVATERYNQVNKPNGVIVSFDADATCEPNYLSEICHFFSANPSMKGCSIYFEHPIKGNDYTDEIYRAITNYELYLRYYIQAQRYCSFPYAFHAIGSCFAVRANTYARQGGMNKRKAGEDFYFLHKVIPLGGFSELNTTTVMPSPRPSNRVPFGTGAAVRKMLRQHEEDYYTYPLNSFLILKELIDKVESFHTMDMNQVQNVINKLDPLIRIFLEDNNWKDKLKEIKDNSTNLSTFKKRFYTWFSAFRLLKFLNFTVTRGLEKIPVDIASAELLAYYAMELPEKGDEYGLLENYRKLQKHDVWSIPAG